MTKSTGREMLKMLAVVAGAAMLILSAQAASADELTVYANKDTWVYSGTVDTNYGASVKFITNTPAKAFLYGFDVSALPENYQIQSITLSLNIKKWVSTISVYALSSANGNWVEGTGDATVTGDGATWNTKDGTNAWAGGQGGPTVAGVDYDSTLLGSAYMGVGYGDVTFTGTSAELTALIDSWLDGQNEGLLVNPSGKPVVYARESGTATAPQLTVEYTVVPEPATMAMLGLGGVMMLVRRRRKTA